MTQDELNQLEESLCSFWKPQKEETKSLTFTYEQVKAHIKAAKITEREACANVCEDYDSRTWKVHRFNMADEIAAAIRARGEK